MSDENNAISLPVLPRLNLYIKKPIKIAETIDIALPMENEIPKSFTKKADIKEYTGVYMPTRKG